MARSDNCIRAELMLRREKLRMERGVRAAIRRYTLCYPQSLGGEGLKAEGAGIFKVCMVYINNFYRATSFHVTGLGILLKNTVMIFWFVQESRYAATYSLGARP